MRAPPPTAVDRYASGDHLVKPGPAVPPLVESCAEEIAGLAGADAHEGTLDEEGDGAGGRVTDPAAEGRERRRQAVGAGGGEVGEDRGQVVSLEGRGLRARAEHEVVEESARVQCHGPGLDRDTM